MNKPLAHQFTSTSGTGWSFSLEDLALVVRTERTKLGISQGELAIRIGTNVRHINRIENTQNKLNPGINVIVGLSNALGLTLEEFVHKISDMALSDKTHLKNKGKKVLVDAKTAQRFQRAVIDLVNAIEPDIRF